MDTGRRHTTPGSHTRDNLLFTAVMIASVTTVLCLFSKLQFPQGNRKMARWHLHKKRVVLLERNLELRKSESFLMTVSILALCSGERLSLYSKVLRDTVSIFQSFKLKIPSLSAEGETISVFQSCSLNKHPWKESLEQKSFSDFFFKDMQKQKKVI